MRKCGMANSPAGDARARLWFSEHLSVHVTEVDTESALPRVLLVATNVTSTFPTGLMCAGAGLKERSTR